MFEALMACVVMSAISFSGGLVLTRASGVLEWTCLTVAAATMCADALIHLIVPEEGFACFLGALSVVAFEAVCEGPIKPFGIANLAVEALHNLIDGATMGAAFATSRSAGYSTALAVAIHELPQELGDFAVLRRAGLSVRGVLWWNFLASLTSFFGVFLGQVCAGPKLSAFTAGSFLGLALHSIAPQALQSLNQHRGSKLMALLLTIASAQFLVLISCLEDDDHHHHHHHH
ncbi:hypothetical protein CTAYLR_000579 [Chrysophaeum taylorii]|uniref:Uncharacterized protein n=1 Tax=Chrysophaeum taylorii TaxID=2483200 RepID=A0AAD7UJ38_9STRA|nr:hypothetical protein CTAYLR_000579 [Chrysophaeum taylorii]